MGKLDNTLIIYISGDNGTSAEGTLEGTPNQMTAYNAILDLPEVELLRYYEVVGLGHDLSAHVGRVVVGVRYAVQMDEAGRVAFRRHPAGHGRLLARPHQRRRRHPHAVPSHHRHRADDPRSHGHPGAGHGQRHRAKAHRRREHGVHVRQGECQCEVEAGHAIFRDVRQSRDLSRRLVCLHDAARAAVEHGNGQAARRQRVQVGALQHRGRLLAKQRPRRQESREAQGAAGAVPVGGGEIPGPAAGQLDPAAAHLRRGRARRPGKRSSPTRVRMPAFPSAMRRAS